MAGVFGNIDQFLDKNLTEVTDIISAAFSSDLMTLATTGILLYIIFYGYMVLAGKVQAPVQDLVWNLARFGLLITFMNSADVWLDLTKEAIKGLSSLGGASEGLGFIDNQFDRVSTLAAKVSDKAPWGAGWAISLLIWTGFALSCFPAAIIIIVNKISLYFLLALLPLFIFCLMWGWLKESFNNYMSALLSNALVIIVMTTTLKAVVGFFESFSVTTGNTFLVGFSYLLTGLFGAALVKFLAVQTSGLMKLSVERIPNGMSGATDGAKGGAKQMGKEIQRAAKIMRS